MEVIKLILCRLCALNKSPDEIVGQINSTELDIESKLIVCCQWNAIGETQFNEMPQNVCASCYTSLNQSWKFAGRVKFAQIELYSKLMNGNIALDAELEPKIEPKLDYDDNEDAIRNALVQPNFIELKPETDMQVYSPLNMEEQTDDFDPMDQTNDFDCSKNDVEPAINTNIIVRKIDLDKPHIAPEFIERTFLKSIAKNDRNTDGSIKLEAIQRLGLDNWSIIQFKCYLCKLQLPDNYELRSHIKIEHPGHPFRHLCNICNIKHYKQRKPLFKHVISNHRRYFEFW